MSKANRAARIVADRREALRPYIAARYEAQKKQPPERILWFASPLQAYLTLAYLQHPSWRPVWKSARNRYGQEVWSTFKAWFFANFGNTLDDPLWDHIGVWIELTSAQDRRRSRTFETLIREEIWAGPFEPDPLHDLLLDQLGVRPELLEDEEEGGSYEFDIDFDRPIPFFTDSPVDYRYPTSDDDFGGEDTLVMSLDAGILPGQDQAAQCMVQREEAGWWWAFERICVIASPPTQIYLDDRGRLHNMAGPALVFQDGWSIYCLHGVNVPANAVLAPYTITVEQIDAQTNAEIRRALIECYGLGRYIEDSGAVEVQSDQYGVLYRRQSGAREPLLVVKVINRTPERDGSYHEYFIRVPPTMRTAHEAVAWTFGLSPASYHPAFES